MSFYDQPEREPKPKAHEVEQPLIIYIGEGKELELSRDDTLIHVYDTRELANHVSVIYEDEETGESRVVKIFEQPELIEELLYRSGYSVVYSPEPSPETMEFFMLHHTQGFDAYGRND